MERSGLRGAARFWGTTALFWIASWCSVHAQSTSEGGQTYLNWPGKTAVGPAASPPADLNASKPESLARMATSPRVAPPKLPVQNFPSPRSVSPAELAQSNSAIIDGLTSAHESQVLPAPYSQEAGPRVYSLHRNYGLSQGAAAPPPPPPSPNPAP